MQIYKQGGRRSTRWGRRIIGPGLVLLLALAGSIDPGRAAAAPAPPALKLRGNGDFVLLPYVPDYRIAVDVGAYLVAGGVPFEIKAERAGYAEPVRARRVRAGRDQRLPRVATPDLTGLADFSQVTITSSAGRRIYRHVLDYCPDDAHPARFAAGARAVSRFATACAQNPFALGADWGIEAGWGSHVVGDGKINLILPPDTYTATTTITKRYRDLFKINSADATVKTTLLVTDSYPAVASRASGATSGSRPARSAEQQVSAVTRWLPDLRALPAYDIHVNQDLNQLEFTTSAWNAGPGRLSVWGQPHQGRQALDGVQHFYDAHHAEVAQRDIGPLAFDEGWQVNGMEDYRLLDRRGKAVATWKPWDFCLRNDDPIDLTVAHAVRKPQAVPPDQDFCRYNPAPTKALRGALDVGQGSSGWGVVELATIKNGTYRLETRVNVARTLFERRYTNNAFRRTVVIGGTANHRTVRAAAVGLIKR